MIEKEFEIDGFLKKNELGRPGTWKKFPNKVIHKNLTQS